MDDAHKVLSALSGRLYGLEISRITGLSAGALYPILADLEAKGLIQGEWDTGKKYYRLEKSPVSPRARSIMLNELAEDAQRFLEVHDRGGPDVEYYLAISELAVHAMHLQELLEE